MPLHKTSFAFALATVSMAGPQASQAEDKPEPPGEATRLREITFTSTRTERRVDDVPNTVTVKPATEIEASGARDLKDLLRNELDVTVRAAPARFTAAGASTGRAGNEGINVRGLEGNQVLMLVDGIRVPNGFSFGAFASGRADYLDINSLKSVEVLRGPASTQYGSDGLAGAVSLTTLSPEDLLKDGKTFAGFARFGVASVDDSWHTSVAAAGAAGPWKGLLMLTHRAGHETDNRGDNEALDSNRTAPNPLDYRSDSLLGKLSLRLSPAHELGLAIEARQREQSTEVYSARAPAAVAPTSTLDLDADDRIRRERVSIEHRYDDLNATWLQKARTRLYLQHADVRQFAIEDRNTAVDRTRDGRYSERIAGLSAQAETQLSGALNQRLSYGADFSRNRITGLRDGTVPPPGETFPVKPFPDTRYTLAGAFAQSEIEAGAWTLIPGLRFDQYKLVPSADGYTGGAVATLSDEAITPRLAALWRLSAAFAPYVQVAKGFRAPTPDQVNNGFTNLASGYRTIGNPDLKPEHAASVEIGARGRNDTWRWHVSAFDNRYKDFIAQQIVGGSGTPADPTVFQYINLSRAHIRGVEVRTWWQLAPRWTATAGAGVSKGDSTVNGVKAPLETIEPARASLGVRYETSAWTFDAHWLHSEGKAASRSPTAAWFLPSSYDVVDVGATWQINPTFRLIANLHNVGDVKYSRWSDVRGQLATSTTLDAFTAPGRSLQVALRADF